MSDLLSPKATDSLETWLSYLEKSHFKPIDMGLERISGVARALDLLKPAPYVITVAGTNGKGSTCKMLETALLKSGYRVGVYSSPHLLRYNERVRIQGEMLDDEAHIASFAYLNEHKTVSLTYFEFSTLSALQLFKQARLDIVILEVGLGGRLDATNIVDPNLAVITSIDIDHVEFLGDNRETIGREKAGILRKNIPVIIGEPNCPASILAIIDELHCHAFMRMRDWQFSKIANRFEWQSSQCAWYDLPVPNIPYPNAATAIATLMKLPFGITEDVLRETLSETTLIGRFQQLSERDFAQFSQPKPKAKVIIDVGHNPHAARYLAERLQELRLPQRKIFAVFSALVDKDLSGIVKPLARVIDEWHCVGLDNYRGQSGVLVMEKLTSSLPIANAKAHNSVADALSKLFVQANENDIVLIFGSFYTVTDGLKFIQGE